MDTTRILDILTKTKNSLGCSLRLEDEAIQYVNLRQEKNEVKVVGSGTTSLEDTGSNAFKKGSILRLSVWGKGLLVKDVSKYSSTGRDLVKEVIPNAVETDFYWQESAIGQTKWLSLIRKDQLDKTLQRFRDKGWIIQELFLGFAAIGGVLQDVYPDWEEVGFFNHFLSKEADGHVSLSVESDNASNNGQSFLGEDLNRELVLAYATAFQQWSYNRPVSNLVGFNSHWTKEAQFKILFERVGYSFLGLFVLALLANTLLFFEWSRQNSDLSSEMYTVSSSLDRLEQLEKEYRSRKKYIDKLGWSDQSRLAYLSDQIGATVLGGIELTRLNIFPLDEEILKLEKKQYFEKHMIVVSGYCPTPGLLNTWISKLNAIEWVAQVSEHRYELDERKNKGKFELTINLKAF